MARYRAKYRDLTSDGAADAPAPDVGAVTEPMAAPGSGAASDSASATPDLNTADHGDESLKARLLAKTDLPPLAVDWLISNPQYLSNREQNERLQSLHHELVAEGFEGYSAPYFAEMETRLNDTGTLPADDAIDRVIAAARSQPRAVQVDPPRRHAPVSAPPSREVPTSNGFRAGNSRITLTTAQKEAARIAGINEVEYARGLMRLNQEKAAGHYGGQP